MALLLLNAAVILSLLGAVHWYLWRRLVKDVFRRAGPWRRTGAVLVSLLAATAVGVLVSGPDGAPFGAIDLVVGAGYPWLTLLLYLTPALLLGELVRPLLRRGLARRAAGRAARPQNGSGEHADGGAAVTEAPPEGGPAPGPAGENPSADASRRLFVARTVAIGATTVATGLTYAEAVAGEGSGQQSGAGAEGVEISFPFAGLWRARNSPARRIPSHGTDLLGGRYAIDFIGVDDRHRTTDSRSWRTLFATEPPEIFFSFGRPILAPVSGTVVEAHDAEQDHDARRSQFALVPYALGQAGRIRDGVTAIAGNYVIISLPEGGVHIALVHFKAGSVRVSVGQTVTQGQHIADCGNSGNSTQPHVHMQAMDSADLSVARGVPMLFRRFREWPSGPEHARIRELAVPDENAVVAPLPAPSTATGR